MIPGTVLLKRERGHEESSVFTPFEDKKKGRREKGREGRIPIYHKEEREERNSETNKSSSEKDGTEGDTPVLNFSSLCNNPKNPIKKTPSSFSSSFLIVLLEAVYDGREANLPSLSPCPFFCIKGGHPKRLRDGCFDPFFKRVPLVGWCVFPSVFCSSHTCN